MFRLIILHSSGVLTFFLLLRLTFFKRKFYMIIHKTKSTGHSKNYKHIKVLFIDILHEIRDTV